MQIGGEDIENVLVNMVLTKSFKMIDLIKDLFMLLYLGIS
jgi:hypothetical protein